MFLQKASKRDIYEVQRASLHGQKPPPRRYVGDHQIINNYLIYRWSAALTINYPPLENCFNHQLGPCSTQNQSRIH